VYFRLNALLRNRNIKGFEPFKDFYWYLRSALGKIPGTEATVWRGMAKVTLERLGPRYMQGRTVCLLAFTSVTTDANVMQDFAGSADGVLLKIKATEARSIAEYSVLPKEDVLGHETMKPAIVLALMHAVYGPGPEEPPQPTHHPALWAPLSHSLRAHWIPTLRDPKTRRAFELRADAISAARSAALLADTAAPVPASAS